MPTLLGNLENRVFCMNEQIDQAIEFKNVSNDFFSVGITKVLNSLFHDIAAWEALYHERIEVWIFCGDSVNELLPLLKEVKPGAAAIVFGGGVHKRILQDVPGLERFLFLDAHESANFIRSAIRGAFNGRFRFGASDAQRSSPLTKKERDITNLLLKYGSSSTVSRVYGYNVKTISGYKRRVMKKLKVKNMPELIYKMKLISVCCGQ